MSGTTFADVLAGASVLISAGSGGVGKTTTSAAIGVAAAREGRRVVVVTIDPARRLADALGIGGDGLGNEPQRIDGPWSGELWAAMLDTRATFDDLVARHADPDQAEEILANRFYRNIADSLSGTQEYMAAEKLHALHVDPRFDLVVVDTPPTRNAFDFIEAPHTLTRFLDHRLYRLLMAPTSRVGRAVGVATSAFVRTVSRVVGAAVVEDAIGFFRAFEGLEDGFRQRAAEVADLFRDETTAFVLVTSSRRESLDEAGWFADQLGGRGIDVAALVVNRVQPRPVEGSVDRYRELTRDHPGTDLARLAEVLVDQCETADVERSRLATLAPTLREAPLVLVPMLGTDVHDLDGLVAVADLVVG
ncbi:ArsA family ATPase [Actinomarinicola tropica]|uniref:AAA family ATPase n=1 Tax=Actinomarinicola tropica TaxID=2789776 RepID=A0A5Q2RNM3_9ACTN|nr:ArsA-related P-loop ATPase [Actinomarinicola tropica]QGG96552.1 AAA family ATPase [Actinomarinicola tropica]